VTEEVAGRALAAVRRFAEQVLRCGLDVYGPKQTPLLVDGLNVETHEPVTWRRNGETWILSNLGNQQLLFRTLDGLTALTGDPRYRAAADEALRYAFRHLRSENGLLYWGGHVAYDAGGDRIVEERHSHELKCHYPYYQLMWQVDPAATKRLLEAIWAGHILDWSTLDMNRHGRYDAPVARPWDHDYAGGEVFFTGRGLTFCNTGSDLIYAAGVLHHLTGEPGPLIWARRLAHRYVETRNPRTGLGGYQYSRIANDRALAQFGPEFGERALEGTVLDLGHARTRYAVMGIAELKLGALLGTAGREFIQWAAEDLAAYARHAYDPATNTFRAMLSDGTPLSPADLKRDGYYRRAELFTPQAPDATYLWAYALAFRLTCDPLHWEMARRIAQGHGLGDIGDLGTSRDGGGAEGERDLRLETRCAEPHALLALLELYRATMDGRLLAAAGAVAGNILAARFQDGFFLPRPDHLYARFDAIEALALLRFAAVAEGRPEDVPDAWPAEPYFQAPHDGIGRARDTEVIYGRTRRDAGQVSPRG
jgi:pectate lyase